MNENRQYEAFFELASSMRAMRRLKPDPVPPSVLNKILEAGVQAPSGQNTQPWSFLVLQKPDSKAWFAERYKAAIESRFTGMMSMSTEKDTALTRQVKAMQYQVNHMQEFPVILIVCGLRDWPFKVAEEDRIGLAPPNFGAVYPCVQNILLACRSLNLGAALTTMHQVFEEALCEHFAIPDEYGVVVTIPIGYPMGKFGPIRRKPATNKTHYELWGRH